MNQTKEEHLKERNGCACRPPCEFCYGSETKEGCKELNSLYESFLEIGKNLNDASRTGTEARIALDLVKKRSAILYEKFIKEAEQRVAMEIENKFITLDYQCGVHARFHQWIKHQYKINE